MKSQNSQKRYQIVRNVISGQEAANHFWTGGSDSTQRNSRQMYAKIQTSSCCYKQNWSGKRWLLWKENKQRGNIKIQWPSRNDKPGAWWILSVVTDWGFGNALSIDDICFDGVHPNNGGIKNLVENIRHYNITHNLPASQNTVQPRKLHRNLNFAWVE